MKSYLLFFLSVLFNVHAQSGATIDYVGNYKAKSSSMGNTIVTVDKENKAIFTVVNSYKYECNCKVLNSNTLGCYMVKLLNGRNMLNPKAGEFLFAIIYESGNYYPFFRGDIPPFTNNLPAEKLFIKKGAIKFIKSK